MFNVLHGAVSLLAIPLVAVIAVGQTVNPPFVSLPLDGPPVIVDDGAPRSMPTDDYRPLLTPKLTKQLDEGKRAFLSGQYGQAKTEFEELIKVAPANPEINFLLGVTSLAVKDFSEADTCLTRATSLQPRDPAILTALGVLRLEQLRISTAIDTLLIAVNLNRKMYLPHLALANAFLLEKEFSKSVKEAQQALHFGKRNASEAKFIQGLALAHLGRTNEAAKSLRDFVMESPDDAGAGDARKLLAQFRQ